MVKSSEPILLFLHGTASSSKGSFGGLWNNSIYRQRLASIYGSRIYAFEHRSLTESPISNALDLIKTLPAGSQLHLVSHSRGGMIGELLARTNRMDQEPFTESEIVRFSSHSMRGNRTGYEDDAARLRELNQEMRNRKIKVTCFVRVACPARGTTLAAGKLDRWATVMLNLLGTGLDIGSKALPLLEPVTKGYDLLQNFLLAVVKERTDATILPGLEAMMPDSPLVALLNSSDVKIDSPLHVLAGDYRGDGLLSWLSDCLSEVYYGGETDLVVNTPSMSGGGARLPGIYQKFLSGPKVHHLSYFRRDESTLPLLDALEGKNSRFERLDAPSSSFISRGGREIKRKDNAPIVYVLPGIMGSHIQSGSNRIWLEPFSMCCGEMDKLKVHSKNVSADGWVDLSYEKLARFLADTHEVRPFSYDWRLSIAVIAKSFAKELGKAMQESKKRGRPLSIIAHSMGGLVARLALHDKWDQFASIPGSRLLQLGTPNMGSHSIAAVLTARDDFVQMIERWLDWKHGIYEFLAIVSQYPGVLELLPWPEENGLASDGFDYFDENLWKKLAHLDTDKKSSAPWVVPAQKSLTAARSVIDNLHTAPLPPECCLYVAGHSDTPVAIKTAGGQIEFGWSNEGDGRVPWKTGIPQGIPTWYTNASHGDLASHKDSFKGYLELIEYGNTRLLSSTEPRGRGISAPQFRPHSLQSQSLYPTPKEVLAAATGGSRPYELAETSVEQPTLIEVIHGSLASAESPVLIGSYAGDSLRGTAGFLNDLLGGNLERAYAIGRYPCRLEDAMVFRQTDSTRKPAGAIVVGLGPLGDLLPGELTQALSSGLLEYARVYEQDEKADQVKPELLNVSSLLVGTGFSGLTVEIGTRCILDALRLANNALKQGGMGTRIGKITLFEEMESRAITAVQSFRDLIQDPRFTGVARFDCRLMDGQGGYCGRQYSSSGEDGLYRIHIVADEGALRFTVVTNRARNVVSAEPNQRQAVDGLIRSATKTTHDQPGLSRALFELLVPNGMKEIVSDVRTLMLSVDKEAASYPWELMRETDQMGEPPLAARIELIRQLASPQGRRGAEIAQEKRVFVVGDTSSGMIELPGAQAEARTVADCFLEADYEVNDLYCASPLQVFDALFNGQYRFMHLAGHGVVNDKKTGMTGMVLGPETFLTTAQVSKLRSVPEFIFINCCHLGSMADDAEARWGQLAANLATEFIEMGCKAVIAAGWAVDDQAASTFALSFYQSMFKGERFAGSVRYARSETHRQHPTSNTWGAFQAYGDDRYTFPDVESGSVQSEEYVHPSHIMADLNMLGARIKDATREDRKSYYLKKITAIENTVNRSDFQHSGVRVGLAVAWAELNEKERAISHYRAALNLSDGGLSLHDVEQLANLEIRQGSILSEDKETKNLKKGSAFMKSGRDRLNQLIAISPTVERLSMLGSYWKRQAQVFSNQKETHSLKECLIKMQDAYWKAAELSYQCTGYWDYYPLLNGLEGAFLSAVRGERDKFDSLTDDLPNLLEAAVENGRRQFTRDHQFFHAVAEIDAERISAMWASINPDRIEESISEGKVQKRLIALYRDILRRLGSPREQESTINQFYFLMAMLPANPIGKKTKHALQHVINGIKE